MTTLPDVSGFGLIVWAIIIFLLLILLTVIFLVVYSGVFESVKVGAGKSKFGSLTFAYKYVQGPYSECGKDFDEIMAKVPAGSRSLGIFYDDPRKTPAHETRYVVGAILAEEDQTVDQALIERLSKEGYELFTIPAAEHCVFTSFRYTTQLSIYLAMKRIYPAFARYIKEHRLCAHPMIEVYTPDKIEFFAPLSKQDDFYVPQVAPAEPDAGTRDDSLDSGSHSDSSIATGSEREESVVVESVAAVAAPETEESVETLTESAETVIATENSDETPDISESTAEITEIVALASGDHSIAPTTVETSESTSSPVVETETESKSEGNVTPDPALTPSDAGSEQSGSSFEDLAAEARQIGKVEPSESDIQEIHDEERTTE